MKKIATLIAIAALIAVPLLPSQVFAASAILFLAPSSSNLSKDSILAIQVRENSGTETVNGVQANLSYPTDLLDFVSIDTSPAFPIAAENSGGGGTVRIGRGAFTPVSGGQTVATVRFKVKKESGTAVIKFIDGSEVSSADGRGTNVLSSTHGDSYTIGETSAAPAPGPATIAPESSVPPAPTADTVTVAGQEVAVTEDEPIKVEKNKPLVLKGVTIPNGIVAIYVYSEPKKYTTTADKDGNWTYTVTDLEPGDHRVEIEVTDPVTLKTSERTTLLEFTVQPASIASTAFSNSKTIPLWYLLAAVPVALAAGAGSYWFIHRRRAHAEAVPEHQSSKSSTPKTQDESQEPSKPNHQDSENR